MLPVAPSTYFAHLAKRADPARLSDRARRDAALRSEIRRVSEENWRVYSVRKVWRQLGREGFDVARCTVVRLMRSMGIQGIMRGKPHRTTIPDRSAPCPLDKVNQQFRVQRAAGRSRHLALSRKRRRQLPVKPVRASGLDDRVDHPETQNALAETINGLFKAEIIHRCRPWRSFEAIEYATLEWVDWFKNRRLLEPIGNIAPAEANANFHAALEAEHKAA